MEFPDSLTTIAEIAVALAGFSGLMAERRSGIYLLGLAWLLAHALQQFMRMLFIQPRAADNA